MLRRLGGKQLAVHSPKTREQVPMHHRHELHCGNPVAAEKSTVRVIPSAEIPEGCVTISSPSRDDIWSKRKILHWQPMEISTLSACCCPQGYPPGKLFSGFRQPSSVLTGNYHRFFGHRIDRWGTTTVVLLQSTICHPYPYGL